MRKDDLFQMMRLNSLWVKIVNYWDDYHLSNEIEINKWNTKMNRVLVIKRTLEWYTLIEVFIDTLKNEVHSFNTLSYWNNVDKIDFVVQNIKEWFEWFLNKFNEDHYWKDFKSYVDSCYTFIKDKKWEEETLDLEEEIVEEELDKQIEKDDYPLLQDKEVQRIIRNEVRDLTVDATEFVRRLNLLSMKDMYTRKEDSFMTLLDRLQYKEDKTDEEIKTIIMNRLTEI